MERLFYKHRAFEWEREFRLVISLNEASEWRPDVPKTGIEVEADLDLLIDKVFLGPDLQAAELDSVLDQLKGKRTANPGAGQLREAAQRAGVRSATRESFWFPRPGRMPAR